MVKTAKITFLWSFESAKVVHVQIFFLFFLAEALKKEKRRRILERELTLLLGLCALGDSVPQVAVVSQGDKN